MKKKKIILIALILIIPYLMCACDFNKKNENVKKQNVSKNQYKINNNKKNIQKPQKVELPKIKEQYDSVYDYWQDMKKVQENNNGIYIEQKYDHSVTKNNFNISSNSNIYKKGPKFLLESSPNIASTGEITTPSFKQLYDGKDYIMYSIGEYKNLGQIEKKNISEQEILKEQNYNYYFDLFNWYKTNNNYKPEFNINNAVYNGYKCRLITLYNYEKNIQKNNNIYNTRYKEEVCVSDKYGIAVYKRKSICSKINDCYTEIENLNKIELRNLNDSFFKLPSNIKLFNTTDEYERYIESHQNQ